MDPSVWQFFDASGPDRDRARFRAAARRIGAARVETTVIFQKTRVALPSLGLVGDEVTGRAMIRDKIVELADVRGRLAGGRGVADRHARFHEPGGPLSTGAGTRRARPGRLAGLAGTWTAGASRAGSPPHGAADVPHAARARPDGLHGLGPDRWGRSSRASRSSNST